MTQASDSILSASNAAKPSGYSQAMAVFRKDVSVELRNRAAVNSILLFAVTTLVVVGYAVANGAPNGVVKAALLWITLFFSAFSGLAHVFLHEEETGTTAALRLSAAPGAVYAGKLLFNYTLLAVIALVVVPLFVLMLHVEIVKPAEFVAVLVAGCAGLGGAATIVAVIIAKARGKGALYGALGFPILLPLLFMVVTATHITISEDGPAVLLGKLVPGIAAFAVMIVTASALLFPFIWED